MSEQVEAVVREECRTFAMYLTGSPPDELVVHSYARGLKSDAFRAAPAAPLDDVLLPLARRGPFAAGLADAWARRFDPAGQLRRRLTLLIAVLESSSPGNAAFEPIAPGRVGAFFGLLGAGLGFGMRLVLSLPVVAIARRFSRHETGHGATARAGSGRPS